MRTHEPRASIFDVQVIVVLMLLHVRRAVDLPFLAVAEYDTPGALVKVVFTIWRDVVTLTFFGAAINGVLTVDVGASVVAVGKVVVELDVVVVTSASLTRIVGVEYVKPDARINKLSPDTEMDDKAVLVSPEAVSKTSIFNWFAELIVFPQRHSAVTKGTTAS